jgi:hypothetical protein
MRAAVKKNFESLPDSGFIDGIERRIMTLQSEEKLLRRYHRSNRVRWV